ncbi:hypothetical protein [Halorientalis sp.]|uniref:hypothetical protein n=1 Tax=Halorientalis sp. TaxID=1931229 RepID=UPI00261BE521|nr:hypothetical protein [Halorientalis sp.]
MRVCSHGEQNRVILTYATPDDRQEYCKERALTGFTGPGRATTVSLETEPENLGTAGDPDTQARYAGEVERMIESHDPDDTL